MRKFAILNLLKKSFKFCFFCILRNEIVILKLLDQTEKCCLTIDGHIIVGYSSEYLILRIDGQEILIIYQICKTVSLLNERNKI